jgi:hypothetical protein
MKITIKKLPNPEKKLFMYSVDASDGSPLYALESSTKREMVIRIRGSNAPRIMDKISNPKPLVFSHSDLKAFIK